MKKTLWIFLLAWILSGQALAVGSQGGFSFTGNISFAGFPISTGTYPVIFTIYANGTCALYTETQSLTFGNTAPGVINTFVGSGTGPTFYGGNTKMTQIFDMTNASISGSGCSFNGTSTTTYWSIDVNFNGTDMGQVPMTAASLSMVALKANNATQLIGAAIPTPSNGLLTYNSGSWSFTNPTVGTITSVTASTPLISTNSSTTPNISLAGLTGLGTANQILGMNAGATAYEYKTLTAGTGVTITNAANSVTIATTGSGTVTSVGSGTGLTGGPITGSGSLSLANIAAYDLLANNTSSSAAPGDTTLTALIDSAIGSTQGDVFYRSATAWSPLAPGTSGQFLQTQGASANPQWATGNAGTVTSVTGSTYIAVSGTTAPALTLTGTVPVTNGGTNSVASLNNKQIMVSSSGAIVEAGAMTNGQLLIGSTSNPSSAAALTAGTGVTITNGAGTITIAATGSGGTVTSVGSGTGLTGGPITGSGSLSLANIAAYDLLANNTSSSAAPGDTTLTALIDSAIGSTQGDVFYRSATAWSPLAPGTSGQFLQTQGASANPQWATGNAGTVTSVTGSTYIAVSGTTAPALTLTGTVPVTNGGTGATSYTGSHLFMANATGAALTFDGCTSGQSLQMSVAGIWTCTAASGVTSGTDFQQSGNSFGANQTLGSKDAYALSFKTNGTKQMTITTAGLVGIGITNPAGTLDVEGGTAAASANGANIVLTAQNGGSGSAENGGSIFINPGAGVGTGTAGTVIMGTTAVETEANGLWVKTDVVTNGSGGFTSQATTGLTWGSNVASLNQVSGTYGIAISANVSERMRIDNSGNVMIGTTNSSAQLYEVSTSGTNGSTGTAATEALLVTGGAGGNSSAASTAGGAGAAVSMTAGAGGNSTGVAGTNGANVSIQSGAGGTGSTTGNYGFTLLNSSGGSVGIGTSTPSTTLQVSGTVTATRLVAGTSPAVAWIPVTKTASYSVATTDTNTFFLVSGTSVMIMPSPAAVAAGYTVGFNNTGTGVVTLTPNAAETINGQTSLNLSPGANVSLVTDGTNWFFFNRNANLGTNSCSTADVQVFFASGTWTKPSCGVNTYVQCWGGGGGGGGISSATANTTAGGGGGGSFASATVATTAMGATEVVTVGSGGTAGASTGTNGTAGGTSSVGSWVTAYGGAYGIGATNGSYGAGGGGGGQTAAGSAGSTTTGGTGGTPSGGAGGATNTAGGTSNTGGGGGGGSGGTSHGAGGLTVFGGGGGGGGGGTTGAYVGGASTWGGGGGGGGSLSNTPAGGVSSKGGGNGGAGGWCAPAVKGTVPGGGGGGAGTCNGANSIAGATGAGGMCVVVTM